MKRCGQMALCLALLLCLCTVTVAADAEDWYHRQSQAAGADDLPRYLPANVRELLDGTGVDLLDPATYEQLSLQRVTAMLTALLHTQSTGPLQALRMLLGVVLVSALLGGLDMGGPTALRRSYHNVAVLGAGGILLPSLLALLDTVGQTVDAVTVFMTAFAPVYAVIMAASGRVAGAVSYQTTLLGASGLLTWLIRLVVFPILTVSLALGCTGTVTDGFCLDRISSSLHKAVLWVLGLISTVFSGLLSVQQLVSAAGDSVGVRVARFSLSGFVPVVGNLLSEAYTTVMGCAGLLRTVVGVFGLVAVILIVAPPLIGCVCWNVALHLAGGVAALFGLDPIERLCAVAAGAVRVLIALLAVFALLMVMTTAVMSATMGG
ncbi:MAG: hypothetical protein IJN76_01525 [Clostridia bacterium]|nr:hypothetical protein [Clostridia bacterium]